MKKLDFYTTRKDLVDVVITFAQATKSSSGQYKLMIDIEVWDGQKRTQIFAFTNDMPFIDSLDSMTDIEAIYAHKESYFEDCINEFIYQNFEV